MQECQKMFIHSADKDVEVEALREDWRWERISVDRRFRNERLLSGIRSSSSDLRSNTNQTYLTLMRRQYFERVICATGTIKNCWRREDINNFLGLIKLEITINQTEIIGPVWEESHIYFVNIVPQCSDFWWKWLQPMGIWRIYLD